MGHFFNLLRLELFKFESYDFCQRRELHNFTVTHVLYRFHTTRDGCPSLVRFNLLAIVDSTVGGGGVGGVATTLNFERGG